jgi:hypothetical protein
MSTEVWFFLTQLGLHYGIYYYCLNKNRALIQKAPDYQQELGIGMSLLSMAYLFIGEIEANSSAASNGLLIILGYKMLHLVLGLVAYFITDLQIAGMKKLDPESFVNSAEAEVLNKSISEIQKAMTMLNTSLTSHHNWMIRSEGAMKSVASIKGQADEAIEMTKHINGGLVQVINHHKTLQASAQKITSELNTSVSSVKDGVENLLSGIEQVSEDLASVEDGVQRIHSQMESSLDKKLEEFDAGVSQSLTHVANHLSSNLAAAAEHVAGTYVRDMDAVSKVLNDKINKIKEEV